MAMMITEECNNCSFCEPQCPNNAISEGKSTYVIDPDKCTECVGHFDKPQCVDICLMQSIAKNPDRIESKDQLMVKYLKLSEKCCA